MTQPTTDHEEREADRQDRDRSTGQRPHLGIGQCQQCGAEPNTGGLLPWWDGETRGEELCPYCHTICTHCAGSGCEIVNTGVLPEHGNIEQQACHLCNGTGRGPEAE